MGLRRTSLLLLLSAMLLPTAGGAEISASKRALIEDLLQHSAGAGTVNGVTEMALAEIAPFYVSLVDEVLASEPDLSESDRKMLRDELADFDAFAKEFRKEFEARVAVQELLEAIYVPLYDRYFEVDELREIAAFYRSPAGRKVLQVMPTLGAEGLPALLPRLQPTVMTIVGEILARRRSAILP
jgi:hypothetical protein